MSVTVVGSPTPSEPSGPEYKYPNATEFDVLDGHLHIQDGSSGTTKSLGVFSPGKWKNVYVDGEQN